MATVIALGISCIALFGPLPVLLSRAPWTSRAPRAAIVLWQAIGVAGSVAAIGVALAVASAPLHEGSSQWFPLFTGGTFAVRGHHGMNVYQAVGLVVATYVSGGLVTGFAVTLTRTVHRRSRHRRVLDLVGQTGVLPGAIILEDPAAVAYCLPGLRPRIVLSAGAIRVLSKTELDAVVDHERGHAHAHHELVMLPLASLVGPFGWVPFARLAPRSVGLLLEMAADDFASRRHGRRTVAAALVHLTSGAESPAPVCGFAAAASAVSLRVRRLLDPTGNSCAVATAAFMGAVGVLATPVLAILGSSLVH